MHFLWFASIRFIFFHDLHVLNAVIQLFSYCECNNLTIFKYWMQNNWIFLALKYLNLEFSVSLGSYYLEHVLLSNHFAYTLFINSLNLLSQFILTDVLFLISFSIKHCLKSHIYLKWRSNTPVCWSHLISYSKKFISFHGWQWIYSNLEIFSHFFFVFYWKWMSLLLMEIKPKTLNKSRVR